MKSIRLLILLIISFLIAPSSAHASQALGLSVSPSLLQVTIKPGKTITQVIKVTNLSSSSTELIARPIPFTPDNTGATPVLNPSLEPEWLNYFSFSNADIAINQPFTLGAKESTQLVLSIKVPQNAVLGDHYVTLLITSYEPTTATVFNTHLSNSVGANILVSITDTEYPPVNLEISSFKPLTKPLLQPKPDIYLYDNLTPISFLVFTKNASRFLTEVRGLMSIKQANHPRHLQTLLPSYVLANSERELIASESAALTYHPSITDIGVFTATLNLYTPSASTSTSIRLILVPIRLITALLIVIVLTFIFKNLLINNRPLDK